jgi:AAA+ superfamily ATPase
MSYLREYLALGGMPEVLAHYMEHKDFRIADQIQKELLMGYRYDIAHYARSEEKVKAEKCFLSLGKQLLDKENHKFQYKEVEKGGRAQKFYSSIDWLFSADMVSLSKLVTDVQYDLSDYAREDFFRAYTTDLSLLIAMKDFGLKQHIIENTLLANTKGGLYECLIADMLIKKELPLYFYKNESSKKEIDFLTQKDGEIWAIEVKSGQSRANSLNWLINQKHVSRAYKFHDGNIGEEGGVLSMPLYMAIFL